jgi:DNA-cytosine methyltransferase
MNVLSLFDGMSCGQIALNQLGIKVDKYYASEIDKYAITIVKKNFPNTIHLGDVTTVKAEDLEPIDLLIGGSPCQGFSFAGRQLNFDDPRSALFFEFVRLLKECKPKYFLLENVRMKQQYQDVITEHLGVKPIMINSALVSAQNRVRLYWTNIPNITQPQDKGLILKDILENLEDVDPLKDTERNQRHCKEVDEKSLCMTSTMYKGAGNNGMTLVPIKNPERIKERTTYYQFDVSGKGYNSQQDRVRKLDKPSGTLAAQAASIPKILACLTERRTEDAKKIRKEHREKTGKDFSPRRAKELIPRTDNKVNCLTTSMTKEHIIQIPRKKSKTIRTGGRGSYDRHEWDSVGNKGTELYYRKLTPTECERLQTVPDGYTEGVSNTQRYKMLGNGWTVEVIKHIFSEVK